MSAGEVTSLRRDPSTRRRCKPPCALPRFKALGGRTFLWARTSPVPTSGSPAGQLLSKRLPPQVRVPAASRFPPRGLLSASLPRGFSPLRPSVAIPGPSAPLPLKMSSTFFSRKSRFSKKEHTSSGSQVRMSVAPESEVGDAFAAAGGVLGGVLGLPSQRGRLVRCSESALCMATSDTRRSEVKYRGTELARSRTDATAVKASPFNIASLRAYCAGALDIWPVRVASLGR